MITAHGVELRVGARVLLSEATFRVASGDRIGLVGRNGAGKTTLTKTLAGETLPSGGQIVRGTDIGYLPQDPRTGDPEVLESDRVGRVCSGTGIGQGQTAQPEGGRSRHCGDHFPVLGGLALFLGLHLSLQVGVVDDTLRRQG